MIDREKVTKGLASCIKLHKSSIDTEVCLTDCPYYSDYCIERLMDDALALLTEQPDVVRCMDCKHGWLIQGTPFVLCQKPYGGSLRHKIDYYCADGERRQEDNAQTNDD